VKSTLGANRWAAFTALALLAALAGAPLAGSLQVIPSSPPVDPKAFAEGRALWVKQCIDCHGTQARGSETGPNIIRSVVVNRDRTSFTPGSVLGPFLEKGHPTQSGVSSATFSKPQAVALAHYLRQQVNDTMRGSPVFVPGDVLTGDAKAGEAYFNGEGRCASCHTATSRNLAGIRTRAGSTVNVQQRLLFPMGGGGRGRGSTPNTNPTTVALSSPSGPPISGVLVAQDSFYITVQDATGQIHVVKRTPGIRMETTNPFQAHIDLLERLTDKNIHDLVAYLETLK
jgi:mono/diheme cytochrome c family protein